MLCRMGYLFVIGSVVFMAASAKSAESQPAADVEPKADQILRKASDFLGTLKRFKINAESTTDHLLSTGQKLQHGEVIAVAVQRPDRLRVDVTGERRNLQLIYDGKRISLLDMDRNFYAQTVAPTTIDAALHHAFDNFGIRVPLSDLLYTNSYAVLSENVESGFYVGKSQVRGVKTDHLAFRTDEVDWQIWIEDSRTPLPRKVVITLKWMTAAPQYTVWLSWDLSPKLPDNFYTFVPPANARKIDFLPVRQNAPPKR
jgi:hypothetical protein